MDVLLNAKVQKLDSLSAGTCVAYSLKGQTFICLIGELDQKKCLVAMGTFGTERVVPFVYAYSSSNFALDLQNVQFVPSLELPHIHPGLTTADLAGGSVLLDEENEMYLIAADGDHTLAINLKSGAMCQSDGVRIAAWFDSWKIVRMEPEGLVDLLAFSDLPAAT